MVFQWFCIKHLYLIHNEIVKHAKMSFIQYKIHSRNASAQCASIVILFSWDHFEIAEIMIVGRSVRLTSFNFNVDIHIL